MKELHKIDISRDSLQRGQEAITGIGIIGYPETFLSQSYNELVEAVQQLQKVMEQQQEFNEKVAHQLELLTGINKANKELTSRCYSIAELRIKLEEFDRVLVYDPNNKHVERFLDYLESEDK